MENATLSCQRCLNADRKSATEIDLANPKYDHSPFSSLDTFTLSELRLSSLYSNSRSPTPIHPHNAPPTQSSYSNSTFFLQLNFHNRKDTTYRVCMEAWLECCISTACTAKGNGGSLQLHPGHRSISRCPTTPILTGHFFFSCSVSLCLFPCFSHSPLFFSSISLSQIVYVFEYWHRTRLGLLQNPEDRENTGCLRCVYRVPPLCVQGASVVCTGCLGCVYRVPWLCVQGASVGASVVCTHFSSHGGMSGGGGCSLTFIAIFVYLILNCFYFFFFLFDILHLSSFFLFFSFLTGSQGAGMTKLFFSLVSRIENVIRKIVYESENKINPMESGKDGATTSIYTNSHKPSQKTKLKQEILILSSQGFRLLKLFFFLFFLNSSDEVQVVRYKYADVLLRLSRSRVSSFAAARNASSRRRRLNSLR
ncbi:uncharacterized protein VP01_35g3 [Puccinia sorghi]|uniref:Uncharacterized protein n=1 Tax=Puccinia sorghi TaxID=27349 RepID=A0A0L6UV60_9BASI|nr:uncharacterized protein VP01_35g3 [Puccinia sorghi]